MSDEGSSTRRSYCPRCEAERSIRITVAWQPDFCSTCGADLDDGAD